jgi:hypothetical protein
MPEERFQKKQKAQDLRKPSSLNAQSCEGLAL